ncbi:hypothetical protein [Cytobacillus sp. IB215316]|uniref:hypothetical protein n=1 Tax=Cytobacillus sp. IB215316 TaxID=3097354 RepID=UPI002A0F1378|nr:hypothetical protein [Cytobacillus sp. IB215316]MDX8362973.1 hypothetical protein [Cytobacillus sp. IB215316]
MNYGDTSFIGLVNAEKYKSFVDKDWELDKLIYHFTDEMKQGNILVCQMTEEGFAHSWKVDIKIGTDDIEGECFRRALGYIKVTDNRLFMVDYDCLTMAAQYEDELVPDENCSSYKIDIENGIYQVELIQYYNVDTDEHFGNSDRELSLNFVKKPEFQQKINNVFWCTI